MTSPVATAPSAAESLSRCRALVEPALRDRVGRLHAWPAEMAGYAFGWHEAGDGTGPGEARSAGSGGKGVRQALAVLCAEAAGASGGTAVDGAVAVELVHAFSLLHDDIMDGDETRRRRPAVWKAYGTGPAVLAGDALFALAYEVLAGSPGPHGAEAVRRLSADLRDLVAGQSDDLLFERRPWTGPEAVPVDAYLRMAEQKTGALLGCAAALGALLAGAPAPTVRALSTAGRQLGVAFQAVDDVLGLWGDPATTGKPVLGDLRRRKKTLPVLAALAAGSPASGRLAALLEAPGELDADGLRRAALLVEEAGGREAATDEARRRLVLARRSLRSVPLEPGPAAELLALMPFVVGRAV
ncbi:polyprenyl synthetase family protein [Streptomyces sp. SP18CS02]|uniref:polyprenyl synthetase family protein n=1 Tax=Streptomyces sp. SP18CS02 TaxID=3002531 RepID=UPI002E77C9A1|nr:polyprenyl synthetase family protein [Streptomyces sp. SP18CS02]MEE1754658.1 polyprenyl synthetase family protein [Streptomyces sp. SP18CS02]